MATLNAALPFQVGPEVVEVDIFTKVALRGIPCAGDGVSHNGKCYVLVDTTAGVKWEDASFDCSMRGGMLANIEDGQTQQFLTKQALKLGSKNSWYFGLNERNTEGTYEFLDGTVFGIESYSYFPEGEPDDDTSASDYDCVGNGKNYFLKIDSPEENAFIYDKFVVGESVNVWLGLTDSGTEGIFKWLDGSILDLSAINIANPWNTNEPSIDDKVQNCVIMAKDKAGKWKDMDCDLTTMRPVCEMEP
ncbi:uncharacterized protein LOC144448103 [Glandiceps talaboti]